MNLSLLLATCDSYSFLWENLEILLKRNLNVPFAKKIVSCETKNYIDPSYQCILLDTPIWGNRIVKAINEITTDYVFFIFDDYYISKNLSEEFFDRIIKLLDATEYNKYCLDCTNYPYRLFPFRDNIYIQHQSSDYLTTLQPSIWRTSYLKSIANPNYSPWDFELTGTISNSGYNNKIFMELFQEPFYFNAARRGRQISSGWEEFRIKHGLKNFIL